MRLKNESQVPQQGNSREGTQALNALRPASLKSFPRPMPCHLEEPVSDPPAGSHLQALRTWAASRWTGGPRVPSTRLHWSGRAEQSRMRQKQRCYLLLLLRQPGPARLFTLKAFSDLAFALFICYHTHCLFLV